MTEAQTDEPIHIRNFVLSICDLKQQGFTPSGRAGASVCTFPLLTVSIFRLISSRIAFICSVDVTSHRSPKECSLFNLVCDTGDSACSFVSLEQMNWLKVTQSGDIPASRIGHSFHAIGPDEMILFGGFRNQDSGIRVKLPFGPWFFPMTVADDVYIYNTQSSTWRLVETTGDKPSPRAFHASCYDIRANALVVHGGWQDINYNLVASTEVYALDLQTHHWSKISLSGIAVPSSRSGHQMAYDLSDDSYIMFGDDKLSDTRLLRIDRSGRCVEINATGTRPSARRFFTFELVGNRLYCFGGETAVHGMTDVYVMVLGSDHWTKPLYEGSLSIRGQAGCILNDKIMIFGGIREKASTAVEGASEFSIAKRLFFLTVLEIKESANENSQFKFKIVTVGDSGVGKSCLLTRFVSDVYSDFHVSTIGVDYKTVVTMVKGKLVKLHLWDTAGQERFSVVTGNYYRNADAFVIVYDATCRSSFDHVDTWLERIREHHECGPNTVKLLCANKYDLIKEVVVSEIEGQEKADSIGAIFITTSAKTSGNVDMAFLSVAQNLVEVRKSQQAAAADTRPASSGLQLGSRLPNRPGVGPGQVNCCV